VVTCSPLARAESCGECAWRAFYGRTLQSAGERCALVNRGRTWPAGMRKAPRHCHESSEVRPISRWAVIPPTILVSHRTPWASADHPRSGSSLS